MKRTTEWKIMVLVAVTVIGQRVVGAGVEDATPAAPVPSAELHATARITVASEEKAVPNHSGRFQKVEVKPYEEVPITVSWPTDDRSKGVAVYPIHGGTIDGGSRKDFSLTDSKQISFVFRNSGSPGLYQVILRRGSTEEVLQFYIPLPKTASAPAAEEGDRK